MPVQFGIRLRRPTAGALRQLLEDAEGAALTYGPVGFSGSIVAPSGFRRDHWVRRLGKGDQTFGAAVEAIRTWKVHRGAGLVLCVGGPPAVGLVVAMSAPLPIGYVDAACRVVAVIEEPDRFGFAYGTLPTHPERGEESSSRATRPEQSPSRSPRSRSRVTHLPGSAHHSPAAFSAARRPAISTQ